MTLRRSLFWLSLGFVVTCLSVGFAYSHPGGLDSYGCHHNRKQGGYHCHRGEFTGQVFVSQQEMLQKRAERGSRQEVTIAPPPRPSGTGERAIGTTPTGKTIYEGPRGGRYHYSASGKKVYERRRK